MIPSSIPVIGVKRSASKLSKTPTYDSWRGMLCRVFDPCDVAYRHYGGRGISVCDRWLSFFYFLEDMGEKPPRYILDRIAVTKGYSKQNCRWATRKEQMHNLQKTRFLTAHGVTKPLPVWADEMGIPSRTLYNRVVTMGWKSDWFIPVRPKMPHSRDPRWLKSRQTTG